MLPTTPGDPGLWGIFLECIVKKSWYVEPSAVCGGSVANSLPACGGQLGCKGKPLNSLPHPKHGRVSQPKQGGPQHTFGAILTVLFSHTLQFKDRNCFRMKHQQGKRGLVNSARGSCRTNRSRVLPRKRLILRTGCIGQRSNSTLVGSAALTQSETGETVQPGHMVSNLYSCDLHTFSLVSQG